jgi:hypothetical protein
MAWRRLLVRLALPCSLVLACIGGQVQDSGDFDGGGETTTTEGTSGTSSATSMGSGSTVTTTDSGSSTATEAATAATEGSTAAADSTTGPIEPVACGEIMCDPGQVCVVPCCGGPQPACYEQPPGGDCGTGTPDEFGARCCIDDPTPAQCMMTSWCIPGPCVPDPPYCTPGETISCNDTECTVEGGCFGMLSDDGHLQCRGCK